MSKRTLLIIAGVVIAAAIVWYLVRRYKSAGTSNGDAVAPGGSSNLNSVAPELVGGPSGPDVQPSVSLPVNITLNETSSAPKPQIDLGPPMQSGSRPDNVPVYRGRNSATDQKTMGMEKDAGIVPPEENGQPGTEADNGT